MILPGATETIDQTPTMLRIVSAQEMRRTEEVAFAAGLDAFETMERAGKAVAEVILSRWQARPVLILCGTGNNGGDGYIIAAVLQQAGWPVSLIALGAPGTPEAIRAAARWRGPVLDPGKGSWPTASGLIVDALFGTGLARPLTGPAAVLVGKANASGAPIVAVDVASGIAADTGEVLGTAIHAAVTVTFAWRKPAHLLLPGRDLAGEVVVAGIGLPAAPIPVGAPPVWQNAPALWRDHLPVPKATDHKYSRGHLVAIGGGVMTGAVRLATRAARRSGVGLVSILAPAHAVPVYAVDQPGVIVRSRSEPGAGAALIQDRRVSAFLAGSGLESDGETPELLRHLLAAARPIVIDGGGLDAFANLLKSKDKTSFSAKEDEPGGSIVLTPHEGEFARLVAGLDVAGGGKVGRARLASRHFRAVIVLKGADTVIAAPDGRAIINGAASAYLATAGSGDVLAGVIAGFLAQGMDAFAAAAAAVWAHAEAARLFGPGLMAEDLPGLLPKVIANLLATGQLESVSS